MVDNENNNSSIIQVQNEESEKNTKDKKIYLLIKGLTIIIYCSIIISTELTYREKLFNKSIEYQEDLREKHNKKSAFYNCWKFFSFFGKNTFCFGLFFAIFLFFPINSSFLILQTLNYSNYITNLFKMIYRNPRPYWKSDILDLVCNSGYGNPSGHSLVCLSLFLVLSHVVTNFDFFKQNKKGKILRVSIFCVFIILASLVIISRVLLSAHSINQVIYGSLLGIGIYILEIYIISYHTYSSNEFMLHIISQKIIIIYSVINLVLISVLIVVYFSIGDDKDIEKLIFKNIFNGERCGTKKQFQVLRTDGFTQALAITSILGAHLGIILLIYLLRKSKFKIDYVNEFNQSSVKRWFIRLPILILSGIFLLLNLLLPKNSPLSIIIIFKFALSFFFTTFGIYFVGIFICIYFNFANEKIIKEM